MIDIIYKIISFH